MISMEIIITYHSDLKQYRSQLVVTSVVAPNSMQVILVPLRPMLTEPIIIEDINGDFLGSDLLVKVTMDEFIILVS